jgi:hypothetical protein
LGGAGGWIDKALGRECVVDDATALWAKARPEASDFWAQVETDEGVLDVIRERFGAGNPQLGVVGALVAARLGLADESDTFLAGALLEPQEQVHVRALVTRYLAE